MIPKRSWLLPGLWFCFLINISGSTGGKLCLEYSSSLESLRGDLGQKRRQRYLPARISDHGWGGDTKWATREESKGRLRAREQTWPGSQFCRGLALQTRSCLYFLQTVYWSSSTGLKPKLSWCSVSQVRFTLIGQSMSRVLLSSRQRRPSTRSSVYFKLSFLNRNLGPKWIPSPSSRASTCGLWQESCPVTTDVLVARKRWGPAGFPHWAWSPGSVYLDDTFCGARRPSQDSDCKLTPAPGSKGLGFHSY